MNLVDVNEFPTLKKDKVSGVVFNVDESEFRRHLAMRHNKNKEDSLEKRIENLENTVTDMAENLKILVENFNK